MLRRAGSAPLAPQMPRALRTAGSASLMPQVPRALRTAVILAGGRSSRFGSDKAFALFQGKPLIEILIDNLKAASCEILISGPKSKFVSLGFDVIEDKETGLGPLHVMQNVFRTVASPSLLFVACDMPFLVPGVIKALWEAGSSADLVVLPGLEKFSPLPGLYHRRLFPTIESLLSEGRRDLKSLFQKTNQTTFIPTETLKRLDPKRCFSWNINTVEELSVLVAMESKDTP